MTNKQVDWVVYDQEKQNRNWVDMPKDSEIIGTPLYEHATDYITMLDTGERVMVRKSDSFIFSNNFTNIMSNSEREEAIKRAKAEKDRIANIQRTYKFYKIH